MPNPTWPTRPPAPEEALRPTFEKAFMAHYTNGAHLLERFDTGHYRSEEARAAWRIALEFHGRLIRVKPPKHKYWGAGEATCPKDIKGGNGELHSLRCKVCGETNPPDEFCWSADSTLAQPVAHHPV